MNSKKNGRKLVKENNVWRKEKNVETIVMAKKNGRKLVKEKNVWTKEKSVALYYVMERLRMGKSRLPEKRRFFKLKLRNWVNAKAREGKEILNEMRLKKLYKSQFIQFINGGKIPSRNAFQHVKNICIKLLKKIKEIEDKEDKEEYKKLRGRKRKRENCEDSSSSDEMPIYLRGRKRKRENCEDSSRT